MRLFLFFCLLLWTLPSHACMWDVDTLATEAKGLPDTVQIITGRFERNPQLYYQMRLERVTQELKTKPQQLELYDDAGVASDRLGQGNQAIEWMKKKRSVLDRLGYTAQSKEHWYRYHANLGTFLAHDWLRSGANRKNLKPMLHGRDHIKRAIQINPNAHFGREKYQLMAMEWITKPPQAKDDRDDKGPLSNLPSFIEGDDGSENPKERAETIKGLSGIIVLGAAWESIDIFQALQNAAAFRPATISYLANLRARELAERGKRSLYPGAPIGKALVDLLQPHQTDLFLQQDRWPKIEAQYKKLRAEADDYQLRRTNYMIERLRAGRHPDTDKTFWNEWQDTGPPTIDDPVPPQVWIGEHLTLIIALALATMVTTLGLFVYGIRYLVKRWRTAKAV